MRAACCELPTASTTEPGRWPGSGVGTAGFEPATSSSRTKRATKLRHVPIGGARVLVSLQLHQTHIGHQTSDDRQRTTNNGRPLADQQLGDLDGVEGCPLAEVVADGPHADTAGNACRLTDPANQDVVEAG